MNGAMRKEAKGRSGWTRALWLGLAALMLVGCDGGCDIDGFSEAPFPEDAYDYALEGSGEVRITEHGFGFIEDELDNLIAGVADDGLSFCLEPVSESGADICHEDSECDNGETGCQLDLEIEEAEITAVEPNELQVAVTVGGLHEQLPISALLSDCWLNLYSESGGEDEAAQIPVTVPIEFVIDEESALDDIMIEFGELDADIDDVGYSLTNRDSFGCGALGWGVETFLDGTLRGLLIDQLDDVIDDLVGEQLCRSCGDGDLPCPSGSSCVDDDDPPMCMYDDADRCVPLLLGIEGQLELEDLLTDMVASDIAEIALTGRVADRAEAEPGLTLGLKAGFDPAYESTCVPVGDVDRPPVEALDPLMDLSGEERPDGEPYMFGIGLHRVTMEHLLWSIWASGGLCLVIDGEEIDLLNTDAFSFFVDSLEDIATEQGPMQLRLSPQEAPTVEFGANTIESGDVVEGLLQVQWDDLDVHVYGYVQERRARLFTLRIDLDLPLGIEPVDEGLLLVLGDIGEAFGNIRLRNDDLVAEDQQTFEDLIPTLLDLALPELLDELDEPFELPEFLGYALEIDDGGLTAVDEGEGLGIFASLVFVGLDDDDDGAAMMRAPLEARIDTKEVRIEEPTDVASSVEVHLGVSTTSAGQAVAPEQVEYLYRWGASGPWRVAGQGPTLVLDDPVLRLPGEHQLELKARPTERGWAPMQMVATGGEITVDRRTEGATSVEDDAESAPRHDATGGGAEGSGQAGCQASSGGATGWLLLVVMGLLLGLRGVGRRQVWSAVAVVGLLALGGCSSDESGSGVEQEECEDDEVEVCDEDGECACELICGGGCDDGQGCCYESNECVALPDPCSGVSCEAGFSAEQTEAPAYDSEQCSVVEGDCECLANDPLDMRFYGAYPSLDQRGELTALSVHNLGYRDLMVRPMTGGEMEGEWIFVDGVPEADPVGDPEGPRWGINQRGPHVGTHTATVVDELGQIHVFYRDISEEALRYARGVSDGGEWVFERTDLEDLEGFDSGYYTAAIYRDGQIHVVSTSAVFDLEVSQMRYWVLDSEAPMDSVDEVEHQVLAYGNLDLDEEGEWAAGRPPFAAVYTEWVESPEGELGISFVDWVEQRAGWIDIDDEGEASSPTWIGEGVGPYASVVKDEEGQLHAAYMDRSIPALIYRDGEGDTEWVIDGVRDRASGWSEAEVGHDVQLWHGEEGWELIYHDASTHEIRHGQRGEEGWEVETLVGEANEKPARGLFVGVHRLDEGMMVVDMEVETSDIDVPEATPKMEWLDGF